MVLEEFLKLFEVKPEEVGRAFAELLVGSGVVATSDGVLESIYMSNPEYWTNKFPFVGFPIFPENLPPVDDWIAAGVGWFLTLLGALARDKELFRVGLGGSLYGGGMLLQRIIVRNLPGVIARSPSHSHHQGRYRVRVT